MSIEVPRFETTQERTLVPRRRVARGLTVLFLSCALWACGDEDPFEVLPEEPPSIVLIDLGTLRADRLGAWGYERASTAAIDELAAKSVRFDWAFAQAPEPAAAHASLLTGLYPTTHGMVGPTSKLAEDTPTIATLLAEAGYATAAFTDGGYLSAGSGLLNGFEHQTNVEGGGFARGAEAALAWIMEQPSERPFFVLIHGEDLRAPYGWPEVLNDPYFKTLWNEPIPAGFDPTPQGLAAMRAEDPDDERHAKTVELLRALYDTSLHRLDQSIGAFSSGLRGKGGLPNTVIVFAGAHGENFGERGELLHDALLPSSVRVPLLLTLPAAGDDQAQIETTRTIEHAVEMVDVAPTLLDLAGAPIPANLQGDSLTPLLVGLSFPRYFAFSEAGGDDGPRAATLEGWQLLRHADGTHELFALASNTPLANAAAQAPDKLLVLSRHLDAWQERALAARAGDSGEATLDEETLRQLENLGYIQ